ncbi:fungal-specific transcription factor domain-domain-containing protein [Microdochium bolleyi]|uniref:Fungal-specific transcription factor domain-domain-containing protein n=1 Tax=Microdochium bolleyi TaxID=196109 RepID=A0A136IQC2_9PEZI|nr:fungal-specific transcription factor domain-domain-containing protein [Microdochium bolleyi]
MLVAGCNTARSRRGCWPCRGKRVKCDEQKPSCGRCCAGTGVCDYTPRPSLAVRRRQGQRQVSLSCPSNPRTFSSPSSGEMAACSLHLGPRDHEAIRFFRTSFAQLHHTKNPAFSLFAVMFDLAREDAMVMHMVLSLGMCAMDARRCRRDSSLTGSDHRQVSLHHYSAALRLMSDAVSRPDGSPPNMDVTLTALWLMCLYEQLFGDTGSQGFATHLRGAARLLQQQQSHIKLLRSAADNQGADPIEPTALIRQSPGASHDRLSLYSARALLWLSLHDSAAATCGVGGHLTMTLYQTLSREMQDEGGGTIATTATGMTSPVDIFHHLYRYSNPLYRTVWGEAYPQAELLDDVENRAVFGCLVHASQLRFLVAQLAAAFRVPPGRRGGTAEAAICQAAQVEAEIERLGRESAELIDVAAGLSASTDNSHQLVANIRTIVPLYHAVVLDFVRLLDLHAESLRQDQPQDRRRRQALREQALREIMKLAHQVHKHGGDELTTKVAWPLFLVALGTDDELHRDWILARFAAFGQYGDNFVRAAKFLNMILAMQDRLGHKRVDYRELMRTEDVFILGI